MNEILNNWKDYEKKRTKMSTLFSQSLDAATGYCFGLESYYTIARDLKEDGCIENHLKRFHYKYEQDKKELKDFLLFFKAIKLIAKSIEDIDCDKSLEELEKYKKIIM